MKELFKETKYIVKYFVKNVFGMEGQELPIIRVFYKEKEARAFFETMINEGDEFLSPLFYKEEKTYYHLNKTITL
jgi:hypothetical protein